MMITVEKRDGTVLDPIEAELIGVDDRGLVVYRIEIPFSHAEFESAEIDVFPGRCTVQFKFEEGVNEPQAPYTR